MSGRIFSCSSKLRGTRRSLMISLMMLETACRAWLELIRESFSRSSFESSVRCTYALMLSRFIDSTVRRPSLQNPSYNGVLLEKADTLSLHGLGVHSTRRPCHVLQNPC